MSSSYPAKLLLFGEYTIIKGAKALAVPLLHYRGKWVTSSIDTNRQDQEGLELLLSYLQKENNRDYNTAAFGEALKNGDYFDSNIPQGYGAGSSGAVTAAVYDRFALHKIEPKKASDLKKLQQKLAHLESCFHGASSGADPLVCYLQQGILFNGEIVQLVKKEQIKLDGFFLIDTGISRQTAPLVNQFKKWSEEEIYAMRLEVELIPLVEDALDAFLKFDTHQLLRLIHQISHFQFKYFSPMIPGSFREAWLDALASDHTKLKLCGAGGGGFILGYSLDMESTRQLLAAYELIVLGDANYAL